MTALVLYEPPAVTPLTAKLRVFDLPYSGTVTISQHWGEDGSRTGGAVWDASLVLAHYLDRNHERWLNGSSVMELGSGLGLASIVASRVGFSDVIATDGDPAVVKMARENVADNLSSTEVALLDWADDAALLRLHPPGRALPDLVMAADVIYLGSMKSWATFLVCSRASADGGAPLRSRRRAGRSPATTARPLRRELRSSCSHTRDATHERNSTFSRRQDGAGSLWSRCQTARCTCILQATAATSCTSYTGRATSLQRSLMRNRMKLIPTVARIRHDHANC